MREEDALQHMHVFCFCSQTQFLDVGMELESAHKGAHLADQPVTRERTV